MIETASIGLPRLAILSLLLTATGVAQTSSVTLNSSSALPGQTATLSVTLASAGVQPAALQIRFNYSASDITSFTVSAGPVASAAGKSIQCNPVPGSVFCIVSGMNMTAIGDGVVATISATLAAVPSS